MAVPKTRKVTLTFKIPEDEFVKSLPQFMSVNTNDKDSVKAVTTAVSTAATDFKIDYPNPNKKTLPIRKCLGCNIFFTPNRKDQVYHSDSCASLARVREYRKRKKEEENKN